MDDLVRDDDEAGGGDLVDDLTDVGGRVGRDQRERRARREELREEAAQLRVGARRGGRRDARVADVVGRVEGAQ